MGGGSVGIEHRGGAADHRGRGCLVCGPHPFIDEVFSPGVLLVQCTSGNPGGFESGIRQW